MPSTEGMKAPATVVPQKALPNQKRQIGALRNAFCQLVPSSTRLAVRPPWSQGS
jgi:hypothetical protein